MALFEQGGLFQQGGGSSGPSGLSLPALFGAVQRSGPVKVAVIGSSYTEQMHRASGTIMAISSKSWMDHWNAFTNNSMNMDQFLNSSDPYGRNHSGYNLGIGGQTSVQIRARFADVLARNPALVVIQSGSDNVTAIEQVIADNIYMFETASAAGIAVAYVAITARSLTSWAGAEWRNACQINQRLRDYLRANPNKGIFIDVNKYINDNDTATGRPYVGATDPDLVHYNVWAAFMIGKCLHESLTPLLPINTANITSQEDYYDATANPFGSVWINPFVSTAAAVGNTNGNAGTGTTFGGATGPLSVGRNMTIERASGASTAVVNVESRGPGQGNFQTMNVTPAGAAGTTLFYMRSSPSDTLHTIPAGTWVRSGVYLDVSTFGADPLFSGWGGITMHNEFRSSAALLGTARGMEIYGVGNYYPNLAWRGMYVTAPYQIPANCDRFRTRLEISVNDATVGNGMIKASSFYTRPIANPKTTWGY